jgi:hypothetical protein
MRLRGIEPGSAPVLACGVLLCHSDGAVILHMVSMAGREVFPDVSDLPQAVRPFSSQMVPAEHAGLSTRGSGSAVIGHRPGRVRRVSSGPGPPAGHAPTSAPPATSSAAPSSKALFDWEDSPNISPNNIGPYFDHLASIMPAQDTTQIAQLRQLAGYGSGLGDLDNTTTQELNTAKADALALDNFFGKYGGIQASGVMPF